MLTVTKHQFCELEAARLKQFRLRAAHFLTLYIDQAEAGNIDVSALVSSGFTAAWENGLRTEREIVHYIVDCIENSKR